MRGLIERFRERIGSGNGKKDTAGLTEGDRCLSLTRTRCVRVGQAPLVTLAEFCETHLRGVVSGVHLLPFYPWSSDDGFAVKDYFAVDPALGTWEDLSQLGRSFDLMFDGVINHMSAESEWFKMFLRGEAEFRDFFVTVEGQPDLSQVVRPRALPLVTEFQSGGGREECGPLSARTRWT